MLKRHAHNLSHTVTSTQNMGFCYPADCLEVFPGDSFSFEISDLTRFTAQVAPTMDDVIKGYDVYQVPLRQLFDKLKMDWDSYLTGGENGDDMQVLPTITIPSTGYEPGGLADFLGYPTNYIDPDTGNKVIVGAGLQLNAMPIVCYMHIINENYRDQNFIAKLDLTKYQEFLDGDYAFETPAGDSIDYDLLVNGLFPKAWARDYFGRSMPNTQRGIEAKVPLGSNAGLTPTQVPIVTNSVNGVKVTQQFTVGLGVSGTYPNTTNFVVINPTTPAENSFVVEVDREFVNGSLIGTKTITNSEYNITTTTEYYANVTDSTFTISARSRIDSAGWTNYNAADASAYITRSSFAAYADLSGVSADLSGANAAASIIAFRMAARMQRFGEILQQAGARAVEFTLAMFGVRIPDGRIQRPIFHGSFRMPVIFSEVLQTSQTTDSSPQGNLAGHGITGGKNKPIHIKVIEHGYIMVITHTMPRSSYQQVLPKMLLRSTRWDLPNPLFQHVGEQATKSIELFPNADPNKIFGYVPHYSELSYIPSRLHGHMKDTYLHWNMARLYKTEPVLSARWRYERPTNRSFAVPDEAQMQTTTGFKIKARRCFKKNPQPGIHIV